MARELLIVFERLLARAGTRTHRPILRAYLSVLRAISSAEALLLVEETIDAGMPRIARLQKFGCLWSSFLVQVAHGRVPTPRTFHYSFVKVHLGNPGVGWNKDDWKG
jgi:hypothetical protein